MDLETGEIGDLPLFDEDGEAGGDPAPVRALKRRIADADALVIATPEYNGSIPGALGNALDWASRPAGGGPLRGKPVAILGASVTNSGAASAQAVLRAILGRIGAVPLETGVQVGSAYDRFDGEGRLTDEEVRGCLRAVLASLLREVRAPRSGGEGGATARAA
jgi:chromate reductase